MIRYQLIARLGAAVTLLATADPVLAQTGTLTYEPTPQAVPILPLLLLPMAIAIALLGGRFLRRQDSKKLLGALLLTSAAGLGTVASVQVPQALADLLMIALDQPEGGSVEIPLQAASFTNSSGVGLTITGVTPPPACASTSPADGCTSGLALSYRASCTTAYICSQTLTFTSTAPTEVTVGDTYTVTATASSGLPVTFSSASPAVCTVTGSTVSFVAAGTCRINADQVGDAIYSPAPQLQQIVTSVPPEVTVTKTADGVEGASTPGAFTLTRTGNTTGPLTVAFTLGGTATGIASEPTADKTDDEDYRVDSLSTVTIPAGEASIELAINVLDDQVYDPSETVSLSLTPDAAYTIGTQSSAELSIIAPDKRLFVTNAAYNGDLGGIAGADAKCDTDTARPDTTVTYKAMLAADFQRAARPAMDWVLQAGASYFRSASGNLYIATATANAVFSFPVAAPLTTDFRAAWTGMEADWRTFAGVNCSGWQTAGFNGSFGQPSVTGSDMVFSGVANCGAATFKLICAEM